MRVGRRFLIAGLLQGVGFRFFARSAATREGLSGTVANLAGGLVEFCAEGDREALDRFERGLHQGLPGAEVQSATASWIHPERYPSAFTICEAS